MTDHTKSQISAVPSSLQTDLAMNLIQGLTVGIRAALSDGQTQAAAEINELVHLVSGRGLGREGQAGWLLQCVADADSQANNRGVGEVFQFFLERSISYIRASAAETLPKEQE
jgi:hypothetical protein